MKKTDVEKYKNILENSEIAEEFAELKKYLHEHTTKAFIQLAQEAYEEREIKDSNLFLALMAQDSKYDIISCLWVIIFKCNQLLQGISEELSPRMDLLMSLMRMVENILADYSVLIDEGKLESANKFFPKAKKLLNNVIAAIEAGALDKVEDKKDD